MPQQMTESHRSAGLRETLARLPRPRRVAGGWWPEVALLAALAGLTVLLATTQPLLDLDLAIARWCDAHRPHALQVALTYLNRLGQAAPLTVLALVVAGAAAVRHRSVRPVLPVAVTYPMMMIMVGPIKLVADRLAPHAETAHPERLFEAAGGMSYPSGHVANAVAWYVAIAIILGRTLNRQGRWALMAMPPMLITVTTVYLGYHWLSDDLAGLLIGVVAARLLLRVPWDLLPLGDWLGRRGLAGPAGLGDLRGSPELTAGAPREQ